MIVHLSASTDLAPDPNNKQLVCTPEYAVRLGATAVSVHVNLGSPDEPSMLKDLGRVAEQCDHWGIPLLAMMYVRGGPPEGEYDPGKVAHAARVAEELGADIVKVNYTGSPDTFAVVTGAVKVPVLIAGGPRMSSIEELLVTVRDALRAGAKGVALGRNVFQDPRPKALARTIRRLIDDTSPRADIEALVHDYHMNEACTRGERSG